MPKIALLPGDGYGPSIIEAAERTLSMVADDIEIVRGDIGFAAYERTGEFLPYETKELAVECGDVICGPVKDCRDESGKAFNPLEALKADLDLYAKWKYTGVSGSTVENVTVGSTNTVSFNTSVGLYCEPDAPGSNSISFTVGVLGGFVLDGSVTVTSTGGHITQLSDGRYLLTGISGNVTVNITGETTPIQDPDDDTTDDNPNDSVDVRNNDYLMYAIILIVIAIICVALAVYIMKTRGSRV